MNPELRKLLEQVNTMFAAHLAAGTAGEAERRIEFVEAMRKDFAGLSQPLINVGFAAGRTDRDKDVATEKTRADTEKARADKASTDLTEIQKANGDVAKVQTEAATRIEAAERKATEAAALAATRVENAYRDRDLATFEGRLLAAGMNEDYAKAQGILLRERMTYKEGVLSVMQKGSDKIPYTTVGNDVLKIVADEVVKASPTTVFTGTADRGTGEGGTGGGGGGGGAGGSFWDNIQKEQQAKDKLAADSRGGGIATAYGATGTAGR